MQALEQPAPPSSAVMQRPERQSFSVPQNSPVRPTPRAPGTQYEEGPAPDIELHVKLGPHSSFDKHSQSSGLAHVPPSQYR